MKATSIKYNLTEEDNLSTRALNVIKSLGGEQQAFKYFSSHDHFLDIPKIGKKTNKELMAYFKLKKEVLEKNSPHKIDEKLLKYVSIVFEEYQQLKSRLPKNTKSVLSLTESNYDIFSALENKAHFIQDFINEKIEFKKIKSIGEKANKRIKETANLLASYINDFKNTSIEDQYSLTLKKIIASLCQIKNLSGIDVFVNRKDVYYLNRITAVMVMNNFTTGVQPCVLKGLIFSTENRNVAEIANVCKCSKELVRVYTKRFLNEEIPKIVEYILSRLNHYKCDEYIDHNSHFILIEQDSDIEFKFNNQSITTNKLFISSVAKAFYSKSHIAFEDIMQIFSNKSKVFVSTPKTWLLNKIFVNDKKIKELLTFLEKEIFNFESVGFEYDLSTLIRRFYKERNIEIEKEHLNKLSDLIAEAKQKQFHLELRKIKQKEKSDFFMDIHDALISFLKKQDKATKSSELLNMLSARFFYLELTELLKLLNRSSMFRKIGADSWILTEKLTNISLTGNIIDIVHKLLEDSPDPIHISDFLNELSKLRDINERSLITNLKISKKFQFFNCGYIGLKSRKYHLYWHLLPRINGRNFTKPSINRIKLKYYGDLIKGFREEFGYPVKATLHLLSKSKHIDY